MFHNEQLIIDLKYFFVYIFFVIFCKHKPHCFTIIYSSLKKTHHIYFFVFILFCCHTHTQTNHTHTDKKCFCCCFLCLVKMITTISFCNLCLVFYLLFCKYVIINLNLNTIKTQQTINRMFYIFQCYYLLKYGYTYIYI